MSIENDSINLKLGEDDEGEPVVLLSTRQNGAVYELNVEAARRVATGLFTMANRVEWKKHQRKRRAHLTLIRGER